MRMCRITISFLLLLFASSSGFGQKSDDDGTIFLGRSYSFILKEPGGWVLDGSIDKSQGLEAVFYRQGSSWKDGVAVMYARVIHKDETQPTIEKVISNDVSDFSKLSNESKVSDSRTLLTRDKNKAVVKQFYDATNKNHELVAFIDEEKVVVILVLSSRTKDEFEKSRSAFESLVGTYFFVNSLVK